MFQIEVGVEYKCDCLDVLVSRVGTLNIDIWWRKALYDFQYSILFNGQYSHIFLYYEVTVISNVIFLGR